MEYKAFKECIENRISGEWGLEPQNNEDDVFIIRTADFLNDGTIDFSNVVKRNINRKKIINKKLKYGDIIIEKSGGTNINPVGRVVFFNNDHDDYLSNNFTEAIRIKPEYDAKYIFYCLKYHYMIGITKKMFNKTTGIQNLKMDEFLKQKIPSIDKNKQLKIVKSLDNVFNLINTKKIEIDKLEELTKSKFIEMFENKEFKKSPIGSNARFQGGYAFKSKDFVSNGVKLVQISNVNKDILEWKETNRLPDEFLYKYKDYSLKEKDVVMAMTRPIIKSLNEVKIVQVRKDDLPCLLNQRVGRFILNDNLNEEYLVYCCKSDRFKRYVEKMSGNSLQPNISSKQVENYEIYLPPIELQNKFAKFVIEIRNQKSDFEKILKKLEELQLSLMQEYFG